MAGKKKTTLTQFQAWLEGVEEMHPEDWCPTADQWKLIRNKIKTIIETVVETPTTVANNPTFNPVATTSGLPAGVAAYPEVPSGIPAGPIENASPEAQKLLQGNAEGKRGTPNSETGDASPFS